jgi:hypothetical protein
MQVLVAGACLLGAVAAARAQVQASSPLQRLATLGLRPVGGVALLDAETEELVSDFDAAADAANVFPPDPNSGAQRRAVERELRAELEGFASSHTNSAWFPGVHLWLARTAQVRCNYSLALEHYEQAWTEVAGSPDPTGQRLANEISGGLAKLMAVTGQNDDLDLLEAAVNQMPGAGAIGAEWAWAKEMRRWARRFPTQAYKCGLYCLDQLGRLTQPGQFAPKDITETLSSTNGFSAAELVAIGARAGVRVHAALLNNLTNLPVPCIVHLRVEHYLVVRRQIGAF